MISLIIRISLRYVAAFLMARGLLSPDVGMTLAADADVIQMIEVALGALVGVAAEAWLYAERQFGGAR
ncbi:hypothetical protein [Hyphomicrobium sp. ghe19]|uniref:hypothetical protein n=1 Tax=Hyphomicrobium sp. ghe19 TaxID=2682968 RepID=UPI0013672DA3|nr:hypothetical protein HYPP_01934 [Hyphomicrobium sp. ghe19]